MDNISWNTAQDLQIIQFIEDKNMNLYFLFKECIYLKEGKQLVPIYDHLETLVVNQGEKAVIPQLIFGNVQFL